MALCSVSFARGSNPLSCPSPVAAPAGCADVTAATAGCPDSEPGMAAAAAAASAVPSAVPRTSGTRRWACAPLGRSSVMALSLRVVRPMDFQAPGRAPPLAAAEGAPCRAPGGRPPGQTCSTRTSGGAASDTTSAAKARAGSWGAARCADAAGHLGWPRQGRHWSAGTGADLDGGDGPCPSARLTLGRGGHRHRTTDVPLGRTSCPWPLE